MYLIYSDFLIFSAVGFISPIVAVYVTGQIRGGSLSVVGWSTAIYWGVKSLAQLPLSAYVDRRRNDVVTYNIMLVGSALSVIVPLFYWLLASEAWHVYFIEAINGLLAAMMIPTWLTLFTKHIDANREATEWALHSNAVGIGYAAAAAAGGMLADRFGFQAIFPIVAACMLAGALLLLAVRKDLVALEHRREVIGVLRAERSDRMAMNR
jgi:MFS family permease